MLNIVIPMAGRGRRFANAGYTLPKPLIPVNGKSMIEVVINNLSPSQPHRFIFVCLAEHIEKYDLIEKLSIMAPGCEIVSVSEVTEGAACTVLLAEQFINNDCALMIANSDQYVDIDINDYLASGGDSDGFIMTMTADDNKWSFIRYNETSFVTEVREKEAISDEATVGIYNFAHGADFVSGAKSMIAKNICVNNEFYVAPVYNELIGVGKKITYYNVGSIGNGMYGLGVPEDLEAYLKREDSRATYASDSISA